MNPTQRDNSRAWIDLFTRLGAEGVPSLERLEQITTPEVRFRDPFNDILGRTALQALLEHTRRQVQDLRFEILDTAVSGPRMYVKWEMTGKLRILGCWRLQGMSELVFADEGRLTLHQDYWDAAEHFYARLPIIGRLLRRLRSLASVS